MRSTRTIAYAAIAIFFVSMLAIGTVSAKTGEENGNMFKNNVDCICDGECLNAGICPYGGNCPYDGQCVNTGECTPNNFYYKYLYDGKH